MTALEDRGTRITMAVVVGTSRCSLSGACSCDSATCRSSSCPRPAPPWQRCWCPTTAGGRTRWSPATEIFGGYVLALVVGVMLALAVHVVEGARGAVDAGAGEPEHDSEGRARAADHRLVQVRRFSEPVDRVLDRVFPILLTTARGLREIEPDLLDLVRSLRGSRWQVFTKIQLPGALPYIFSGMKVARDPGGGGRDRRRVPGLRQGPRLSDAAGAGDARHRRHVHGGDADHADRHAALRRWCCCSSACSSCPTRGSAEWPSRSSTWPASPRSTAAGGTEHLAISDATFDVMPGELAALVGPSGCGKSTLLKILAGLHAHDAGAVRIGSAEHPFDPARDIGMVFQPPLLLKWRAHARQRAAAGRDARDADGARAASGRASCWRWSGSPATRTSIRTSSRAACSSAPRSPARWCTTRSSC